jgi:hypothetical protein
MKKTINLTKYFGKDWKFFWRMDSFVGNWYGVALNRIGVYVFRRGHLTIGRKLIRLGGGTFRGKFYSNCSWCSYTQEHYEGLHFTFSRKGGRCGIKRIGYAEKCDTQPFV